MKTLITNGLIYIDKKFEKKDILIENNTIIEIKENIDCEESNIIDAEGKHIFPGFIDAHTHLRDPGQTYKEDIVTGTKAAAHGGFTTICAMPNTEPVVDSIATVEYIKRKANDLGFCNVKVIGAITKKSEGKEIAEVSSMVNGGVIAVSDDGKCVQNAKLKLNCMKYVSYFDIPVIVHAEDKNLAGKGQINSGKMSTKLGLSGMSPLAEEIMISRDIMLAESAKCHLHIAHISTKKSIDMVREAKKRGVRITCEVTPHHLTLTEDACSDFDTNTKVKPPLRTENDRLACVEGLKDGTIDIIATDHAPHADFEKEKEFTLAPYGINGFETAFSSLYTELVLNDVLPLDVIVDALTIKPAELFKFNTGKLEKDYPADLTIINLDGETLINRDNLLSKSSNTPYLGKTLKSAIKMTICNGRITWSDSE